MGRKKYLSLMVIFTLLIISMFIWIQPVQAQGIIIDDSIPEGQVLDRNAILFGDRVVIDGDIKGDVLVIGRQVILNGNIDGSLVVLSQTSDINGNVSGSIYSGGQLTQLKDLAQLNNDLYFVGLDLATNPNSQVKRDIITITIGASLQGQVGRDIRGLIGPIPIIQAVLNLLGQPIPGLENSNLTGWNLDRNLLPLVDHLAYPGRANRSTLNLQHIGTAIFGFNILNSVGDQNQLLAIDTEKLTGWLLSRLQLLISVFVYSLIAMLVLPKFFHQVGNRIWEKPLQSTGIGLVAVVFIFSATLLIAILLVPIIIFFSILSMHSFAIFSFLIGYTSLTLVGAFIYLFSVFITKGIAGTVFFQRIFGRFAPKIAGYRFLMLFLGSFVYVLLRSIPFIGVIIGIWISFLGLGAAWLVWTENRKRKPATEAAEIEPLETEPLITEDQPSEFNI